MTVLNPRTCMAAAAAIAAGAATMAVPANAFEVAYSAKFICGDRTGDSTVVKGRYETVINIHNPHRQQIIFQKRAAIALPQGAGHGKVSNPVNEGLFEGEALGVNCRNIRDLFSPAATGFIEGFLMIYIDSTVPLAVVEVQTARHRGTAADGSLDVESVHTRVVDPIKTLQPIP